ncbi:MAG: hypothetical protein C0595_01905 [Marinilabiliales bacterium]|nr:MAG: hypothetical protein C0595_01905 [Marinilabiliales bacterium]
MSYHIFESVLFSDGKADTTPIIPNISRILICPECNKEFWKDDAEQTVDTKIDTYNIRSVLSPSDLFAVRNSEDLLGQARYYYKLLKENFANNNEKEIYLRMLLWHELNDIVRYNIPVKVTILDERELLLRDNLLHLIKIFNPSYEEEKLLLAEMYRELGEFDFAQTILEAIREQDFIGKRNELFRACNSKSVRVFKLKN